MRAFGWFCAAVLLALLSGAVVAYPVYLLVAPLGGWPFHRVAGRLAMLILAAELVWLCRHLHVVSRADFGYGLPRRRFVPQSLLWGAVGVATAAVGAAYLVGAGLRIARPGLILSAGTGLHLLLAGVGSGIAVALIEETVMRGAMHTAIEREAGPWAAALLTAPLFAVLHFFAKASIPPEQLAWRSGFDLLLRSFAPLGHPTAVLDAFLAWLAVGLLLSLTRVLTGNIAVAIGLHAGWVLVLRVLQETTLRGASPAHAFWVGRFDGLLGYWLLPWAAAIGVALWSTRRHWVPAARSHAASAASR